MKQRILFSTLALGVFALAPAALATIPNTPMISPRNPGEQRMLPFRDHVFMDQAAEANMAEIALSEMAQEKGQRPEVKAFAEQMITDHWHAIAKETKLSQMLGVRLPFFPNDEQRQMAEKLTALSGDAFDQEYTHMMVDSHAKVLQMFRDQAAYGYDADVRHFAAGLLPTLHMHLENAQALHKGMHGAGHGHNHMPGHAPGHGGHGDHPNH